MMASSSTRIVSRTMESAGGLSSLLSIIGQVWSKAVK
jgi:hypothetical protein